MALLRILTISLFTLFSTPLMGNCCLPFCGEVGIGYDYFRSLPDGSWEGNTGGLISLNLGSRIPFIDCPGYGVQLGGSIGCYDWYGRGSAPSNLQDSAQTQGFISTGVFRKTLCESGFNAGLVYDCMLNDRFGVFGVQTNIDQLRFQGGYTLCQRNEFGLWGTIDLNRSHTDSQQIPLTYRALSQVNAFWKHHYDNCAETMVWAGIPYKSSLMFSTGRAGRFILGASFKAPLTDRLAIEGHASYMNPHSASGALEQRYYAANICIELKWAFGGDACCIEPYLPIGNNSNFIVDTNLAY